LVPLNDRYRRQVALLIAAVPFVAAEREFALKGGTAINLFVRDMPRLSVDTREHSLGRLESGMLWTCEAACLRQQRSSSRC
jgi:hypothetical protein